MAFGVQAPHEGGSPTYKRGSDKYLGMATAIQCRDLRKTYDGKVEAVRGLNLEIAAGECFGLLGPNGAGKTTTIEILEGLLAPTLGQVTILGQTWKENARELREVMGISLQETRLSEKLTVLETIKLFSGFYRQPRAAVDVLEQMQLGEKADRSSTRKSAMCSSKASRMALM